MATAVRERIDAFAAHDLAEQAKQDAEGSCANLGQLVSDLRAGAETAAQRIQGLEAALEASSKAAEEKAVEVDGMHSFVLLHFISYSPTSFGYHRDQGFGIRFGEKIGPN